jgi:pimeloyl-ACP methyl ester carboxylesterase
MPNFKTSDGCRIFFERQNPSSPKPVIVFLNGAAQTTIYWTTIANRLKNDFQILAYDARAQGRSDPGKRPLSLDLHSADLCNLLEYAGVEKAHLVGLSHGSSIALAFASRFPDKVDRLMLSSVTAGPTCRARLTVASWLRTLKQEGMEAMAWAALPVVFGENFLRKNEGRLDKIMKAIVRRNKEDGLIKQLEAMAEFTRPSSAALDIRCPVLVLSASDDPLVTEEGAQELARLCKGRHERLAGLGHSIPAEAPELFIDILKKFLAADQAS